MSDKDNSKSGGLIFYVIVAVIVGVAAGAGFFLARATVGPATAEAATLEGEEAGKVEDTPPPATKDMSYYDLGELTTNLDVPGSRRFISAGFTLAINSKDFADAEKRLNIEKVVLESQLTTYLAGLTLEDVRGEKNVNRICRIVADRINNKVWPDMRPRVTSVLVKRFAVQ